MKRPCALEDASAVLLGQFNPAIFHPLWFANQNLLSEAETRTADLRLTHSELSAFRAGWLTIEVTQSSFKAQTTSAAHFVMLRDLVVGTFQVLEHTPVTAVGINRRMHFRVADEQVWHAFGHTLAPKALWSEVLTDAGLLTMTIQGKRPGSSATYARARVEPSRAVHPGIFIDVNEHYEGRGTTASTYVELLRDNWDVAITHAEVIGQHILSRLP